MATAIQELRKIQAGIEVVSTKGTLVPATVQLPGEISWNEMQSFYRSPYPVGQRANVGAAGIITRKGVDFEVTSELTAEDILWPLHLGIRGSLSPAAGTGDQTWTATPQLTTGIPTLQSATFELVQADGSTNHYAREVGYVLCRGFKIDIAANDQPAMLTARYFGRATQTSTPTGALTPYATREPLVGNLFKIYVDASGGTIGTTQVVTIIRSLSIDVDTGIEPDYTVDGRSDLDFTIHRVARPLTAKLSMTLEFDAVGAARAFTDFRANTVNLIRAIGTGSAAGLLVRTVKIDGAYRLVANPTFSQDGDTVLVSLSYESVYDATYTKTLEFVAINTLTAL